MCYVLSHLIFKITVRSVSVTIALILEMIKQVYLPKIQLGSGGAGHKPRSMLLQSPQAKPLHRAASEIKSIGISYPSFSLFPHCYFIATEASCGYNLMPQGLHSLVLQHSHPASPSKEGNFLPNHCIK